MSDQTMRDGGVDWVATRNHWGAGMKVLHWTMAVLMISMVAMGLYMTSGDPEDNFWIYQLHKSIGFTILGLGFLRLVLRLAGETPPLPEGMSLVERIGAHVSHFGFYALMIIIPLSGWVLVSAADLVETYYFGLFEIPHLPVPYAEYEPPLFGAEDTYELSVIIHELLAFLLIGLIVVHIAAAVKHHFVNRDTTLVRMLPGKTRV